MKRENPTVPFLKMRTSTVCAGVSYIVVHASCKHFSILPVMSLVIAVPCNICSLDWWNVANIEHDLDPCNLGQDCLTHNWDPRINFKMINDVAACVLKVSFEYSQFIAVTTLDT